MRTSTRFRPGGARRVLARVVAGALAIAVIVGLLVAGDVIGGRHGTKEVRGLVSSENLAFFEDARVAKRLEELGFVVHVEAAGSRQIATDFDVSKFDFAFPAGAPAAEKIRRSTKTRAPVTPFFTPMVVASFSPIADVLARNGIATKKEGHYALDLRRYVEAFRQGKRWSELAGNTAYPVDKRVLITSTDVRTSNSAAMYLSLLSFLANGDGVVQNRAQARKVLPKVSPFFLVQGFVETTSEGPFDDYLAIGAGKAPLVMVYESQFVGRAIAKDGAIRPEMVLLYPEPTILSKHTFVPVTGDAEKLGKALATDAALQALAVTFGFRTSRPGAFEASAKENGLGLAAQLVDVVDPPSYEALDGMIADIGSAYEKQTLDPAKPRKPTEPTSPSPETTPRETTAPTETTPTETTEAPPKTLDPGRPGKETKPTLDPGRPRLSTKKNVAPNRTRAKSPMTSGGTR